LSDSSGDDLVMIGALAVGAFLLYLMMNQKAGATGAAATAAPGAAAGAPATSPSAPAAGANSDMGGQNFGDSGGGWD
jgi:hypothetical protein